MTIEEAKEHIPDFEAFSKKVCDNCEHNYYCHQRCEDLRKAERMNFNRILKCYAQYDGERYGVLRWLKHARI